VVDTYVSVVKGPDDNSVSICVMNVARKTFIAQTFELIKAHFDTFKNSDGSLGLPATPDIFNIMGFIELNIQGSRGLIKFLFEVSGLEPYNEKPDCALCPLVKADEVVLKVIVLIGLSKRIAARFFKYDDNTILLENVSLTPEYAYCKPVMPRYIAHNVAKAYADILLGPGQSTDQAAVIAALIAKNVGAYYFWTSRGRVQSSQDLVYDLQNSEPKETIVFSAGEDYNLSYSTLTKHDNLNKIALEYAVTTKKYEHLGTNNAIKVALMQICKRWGIELFCTSLREDVDDGDKDLQFYKIVKDNKITRNRFLVYPLPADDNWVISALQNYTPLPPCKAIQSNTNHGA